MWAEDPDGDVTNSTPSHHSGLVEQSAGLVQGWASSGLSSP